MPKVRVHQLAKELQVESKVLLQRMKSLGVVVVSHQSTITPEQLEKITASYQKKETAAPARPKVLIRRRKRETPVAAAAAAESETPAAAPQPEVSVSAPTPAPPEVAESTSPAVAAAAPEKPPEIAPAVAGKETTQDQALVVVEEYGKVKSPGKSKRATAERTREILRSMEDDIDAMVEEPSERPAAVAVKKTVYVPTGAAKKRDLKQQEKPAQNTHYHLKGSLSSHQDG